MKEIYLKALGKKMLREMVAKIETIDEARLSKLSRGRCIKKLDGLSYKQLIDLSHDRL